MAEIEGGWYEIHTANFVILRSSEYYDIILTAKIIKKWWKRLPEAYRILFCESKKFYEPMLAQKFEDREATLEYPVYSQPKLDGIRCIVQMKDGKIVSHTRTGREIETIPHILEELKFFFDLYPNAVLDGELYNHALKSDFNKIVLNSFGFAIF